MREAARGVDPISYLPVLPPAWATLPSDPLLYERPKPLLVAPPVISLSLQSSCPCGPSRTMFNPKDEILEDDCLVYTLTTALTSRIQLQLCRTCSGRKRRRYIGPEPGASGIFNFNNRILFTHDLLDEYTSAFTSSETPFVAWVLVMERRYKTYESPKPFVSEKVFRAAWFAYVNLQRFDGDMSCPKCGPTPEETIWDGITLGFTRKHLLPSLRAPTTSDKDSVDRPRKYIGKQQILLDATLRKSLRTIVKGPFKSGEGKKGQGTKGVNDCLQKVPELRERLLKDAPAVDAVFGEWFGVEAVSARKKPPQEYIRLFVQVCA